MSQATWRQRSSVSAVDEARVDGIDGAGKGGAEVGAKLCVAVGALEVELEEAIHHVCAKGAAHGLVGVEEAAVDPRYVLFIEHEVGVR